MKTIKEFDLDDKLDKYVTDEIRKRKIAKHVINATDDISMLLTLHQLHATDDISMRMAPNKPAFKFPSPTGNMMIEVFIRPVGGLPKVMKNGDMVSYNYQLKDK